jgi:hypoxanthine phosphoribosyltransferase
MAGPDAASAQREAGGWGERVVSRDAKTGPGDGPAIRQPPLPSLRQSVRPGLDGDFAHPAEQDFSRLLSFYRVRWVYEPTTFALAWAADGRPCELFTPDFYLPDHRLYIELTTMRQRLVTRKNRKLRRLRELYPNVRIKLLYRRDYVRLLDAYPGPVCPPGPCQIGRVLFSEAAIQVRVGELATAIAADGAISAEMTDARPLLVLGVGRGSDRFLAALVAALTDRGVAVERDRIGVTRYRIAGGASRVRLRHAPQSEIAGRRVLLVEDVVSTGLSLDYLLSWLRRHGAAEAAVCTLLDRRAARLVDVPIRYAGFEAPGDLLVGFGLDLRRQFSDLPFIATVEPI